MECKVSKEVQNAFVNILEANEIEEDLVNDYRVIAKALGYSDEEINIDLGLITKEEEEIEKDAGNGGA